MTNERDTVQALVDALASRMPYPGEVEDYIARDLAATLKAGRALLAQPQEAQTILPAEGRVALPLRTVKGALEALEAGSLAPALLNVEAVKDVLRRAIAGAELFSQPVDKYTEMQGPSVVKVDEPSPVNNAFWEGVAWAQDHAQPAQPCMVVLQGAVTQEQVDAIVARATAPQPPADGWVCVPPVVREAIEATFEQREGHLKLVAAAVRALAAPQPPAREPMTPEQRTELLDRFDWRSQSLHRLIEAVEQYHGITGGKA